MQLRHIDLENLKPAGINVRKKGGKDVGDLVPSIRSLGIVQPLLVRLNCEGFEIVAGQRRYHALKTIAEDGAGEVDSVPCIVMDEGDDAKAIEASLAENIARLPMDEIDQYKAFAALIKQGEDIEEIAARFGVSERLVRQRLAIAGIIAPILSAYGRGDIHPATLRILTMASKAQQKAWLALFKSEEDRAPEGYRLKCWLFGGAEIPVQNALFDVAAYDGAIIGDLFDDKRYFDDAGKFWTMQNAAIAKAKEAYLADGWADVIVLDVGEYFPSYAYVETAREEGGKVYVSVGRDGAVTFYEGQLSRKEIKAKKNAAQQGSEAATARPELTKPMQNYLDLHRHAAVRVALLDHSGIALRLAVAQIIAGSSLWQVEAESQKASSEAIADSLGANKAHMRFIKTQKEVIDLLGLEVDEAETVVPVKRSFDDPDDLHALIAKLLGMEDEVVMRVLSFIIAETLPSGTAMTDALGKLLGVSMEESWSPDQVFFDLLRDKQAINEMVAEVAGKDAADAHISETVKVQKRVMSNALDGSRSCEDPHWQPRYMTFPMGSYRGESGLRAVGDWQAVSHHYE